MSVKQRRWAVGWAAGLASRLFGVWAGYSAGSVAVASERMRWAAGERLRKGRGKREARDGQVDCGGPTLDLGRRGVGGQLDSRNVQPACTEKMAGTPVTTRDGQLLLSAVCWSARVYLKITDDSLFYLYYVDSIQLGSFLSTELISCFTLQNKSVINGFGIIRFDSLLGGT